jgi:putative MFS transporter
MDGGTGHDAVSGCATIAQRLDDLPPTRLHVVVAAACGVGMALDTFEISFGSILAAFFSTPPQRLPSAQLGALLGAVYVGAVVGAPLLGWVADKWGRRNALVGVLLWIAAMSMAAAFSDSVQALTVFRALAGLALGAYPPIAISYMADVLPPRSRGMLMFGGLSLAALGPPAAVFLVRSVQPAMPWASEAWRWGLFAGALGGVAVAVLFACLPESPRWLAARGRSSGAEAALLRFKCSRVMARLAPRTDRNRAVTVHSHGPEKHARQVPHWACVGVLFLLSPWSTATFPVLVGAVLGQKGFNLSDTLLYLGLGTLGPFVGMLLTATVVDRIERRLTLAACGLAMVAAGFGFVASNNPVFLVGAIAVFNLSALLYLQTLGIYGAENFSTQHRASAMSTAWALNRIGAALSPLLLVPMLREAGPVSMFAVIAATLLTSVAVLAFAPAGRQQRAVR